MPGINIGVLISGGGTNLQALIDASEDGTINGNIKLVISNKKDAYGLERAKKKNIEAIYLDPKDYENSGEYNKALIDEFKSRDVELIVLAGYLKILSKEFIESYSMSIINIHPSLVPSFSGKGYYGENVHRAVLERGVKLSGATVHFVDQGTDTGPIIIQKHVCVDEDESLETLKDKVLKIEHEILVEAVGLYCGRMLEVDKGKVSIRKVQG